MFYPDYIVKMKNDDVWVIETKGGEVGRGISKNRDLQVQNKFEAFKLYAERHKDVKWGFVRDKNEKLYINNSIYTEDMQSSHWIPLENVL